MLTLYSLFKDGLVYLALTTLGVVGVFLGVGIIFALTFGPALLAEAYSSSWYLLLYTVTVVVLGLFVQAEGP